MPEGKTEEVGTKRERFSLSKFCESHGYALEWRALTMTECAALSAAEVSRRAAQEKSRKHAEDEAAAELIVESFMAKLEAIKKAAGR